MNKKRALKNMNIEEVSLVDRPANKRKFLLIKREEGEFTELTIKTDGTVDGTELSVNGEEVDDLKSFWFSLWPADEFDDGMMNGSYTVSEKDGAEFDRETTFNLKKGMNAMKLENLLKALGIDSDSLSADRKQDLESLIKFIPLMPPEDGEKALNVIKASLVKDEAPAENQEDEEDPTASEALAPEKVAEIRSAMSQLNEMLPESDRVVIKAEEPDKLDRILTAIEGIVKKEGDPPGDDSDDPPDSVKDILKRLIKVEETTGNSPDPDEDPEEDGEPEVVLTKEERIAKYGTKYPKAAASWGLSLLQDK